MKREKRATNPSQCGNSCELKFASLKNTKLIHHGDYWLDISESGFSWPSDVELEYPKRFRLFGYKNWISAFNFYKKMEHYNLLILLVVDLKQIFILYQKLSIDLVHNYVETIYIWQDFGFYKLAVN
ncbi:hypothetical protein [Spiroplasma endosymbiont of Asaphidion curtum]|uniref:hypothetical protein n=1 Tax=Spiroplasma endosymbiont of Asaphidion curtum TaxID=3066281 RepID=UPI00313D0720